MSKGVFIIGTDTDVGKTYVSAGLVYAIKNSGVDVGYYKPALSGAIKRDGDLIPGDVDFVKRVADLGDSYRDMNTYLFEEPVSPHLASRNTGVVMHVDEMTSDYNKQCNNHSFVVVEGAGGLVVPFVEYDVFLYDIIRKFDLPVIIVTRASLGTINHTALTVNSCLSLGLDIQGIIVNGYEDTPAIDENIEAIKNITGQRVLGVIPKITSDDENYSKLKHAFIENINIDDIVGQGV